MRKAYTMPETRPIDPTAQDFIDLAAASFKEALTDAINGNAVLFTFEVENRFKFKHGPRAEPLPTMAFIVMPCAPKTAEQVVQNIAHMCALPTIEQKQANAKQN